MEMQNRKRKFKVVIVIICLVLAALCVSLFYDVFTKQEIEAENVEQQAELNLVHVGDNRDTFWPVTSSCEQDPEKYEAAMKFLTFFSHRRIIPLCARIF